MIKKVDNFLIQFLKGGTLERMKFIITYQVILMTISLLEFAIAKYIWRPYLVGSLMVFFVILILLRLIYLKFQ